MRKPEHKRLSGVVVRVMRSIPPQTGMNSDDSLCASYKIQPNSSQRSPGNIFLTEIFVIGSHGVFASCFAVMHSKFSRASETLSTST